MPETVTRFAPSPTGRLHLGHAYSALFAERAARQAGGRFLLRIEDIDRTRCRPEYEAAIYEDLSWLGLSWEEPVLRQSDRLGLYASALETMQDAGIAFPCFCTRGALRAEAEAAGLAPHGPDGPRYPGTCKALSPAERHRRIAAGQPHAWRLDMAAASRAAGPLRFHDLDRGNLPVDPQSCGDVVIARKDIATSYHLAVTLDDAMQGVTLVTRGEDLLHATHVHRVLQAILGLPAPLYRHHRLLTDAAGRRYAKRDRAQTLAALRAAGRSPAAVRAMAGFPD